MTERTHEKEDNRMLRKTLSAVLCCLSLGLLAQPLANPGFELGAANWDLPQPFCRIAPGQGRNGTAALVWENTDTSLPLPRPWATQELKLQANQAYRLSCFVKGRIDQLDRFNIGAINRRRPSPEQALAALCTSVSQTASSKARHIPELTGADGLTRFS